LVKTWWKLGYIFKTWWKPGEINWRNVFCTLKFHQKKRFFIFFGEIYPFWRWNWRQNINLVKTWWNLETWCKLGQLSRTWWMFRWNSGNFLDLMDFLKPGENLVKTWWKPGEFPKPLWTWQ
jgi:hypothetical protein